MVIVCAAKFAVEEGWLVGESEIRLQFASLKENSLQWSSSMHVESFCPSSKFPAPGVRTKVLNRALGNCQWMEQGEFGITLGGPDTQLLVCSARSPHIKHMVLTDPMQ